MRCYSVCTLDVTLQDVTHISEGDLLNRGIAVCVDELGFEQFVIKGFGRGFGEQEQGEPCKQGESQLHADSGRGSTLFGHSRECHSRCR